MSVIVETVFDESTNTASHLAWDSDTRKAMILDSVLDFDHKSGRTSCESADHLLQLVRKHDLTVEWILETHAHADHLTAAPYLKSKLVGAQTAIGSRICEVQHAFEDVFNLGAEFRTNGDQFDHLFEDGERFMLGSVSCEVMNTPGHTPACTTYVVGDAAFVGDTLFMPDFGTARCDFPGGDARELYQSIHRILSLPDETRLFLCHDYAPGGREFAWETTVARQKADNIHIGGGTTEDAFVEMRETRDKTLSMPALIIPSVQVNIRAGDFPSPEGNGISYLKVPLNAL